MDQYSALLEEIDRFLARKGMAETTFGRLSVNDGKLVGRLRAKANITFATAERVRDFIARADGTEPPQSGKRAASPLPAGAA